jgi:hypothetical protein
MELNSDRKEPGVARSRWFRALDLCCARSLRKNQTSDTGSNSMKISSNVKWITKAARRDTRHIRNSESWVLIK